MEKEETSAIRDDEQFERPATMVGGYRELSNLTDLQVRILVAALGGADRRTIQVLQGEAQLAEIRSGEEKLCGPEAVRSIELLLAAAYLAREGENRFALTLRGRRMAELALRSPSRFGAGTSRPAPDKQALV